MARLRTFNWSKGILYIVWSEGRSSRRASTGTRDKKEAARILARFHAQQQEPPEEWIMNDLFNAYLEDRRDRRWYKNLEWGLNPLRPHFGLLHPKHFNKALVRSYISKRKALGRTQGAIDTDLRKLRAVLSWGIKAGWLKTAPYIETPGGEPPKNRWLTRSEAEKLLEATIEPHIRLFVLLGLHTGARSGAIQELTWDRVDLEKGVVMYPPANPRSKKRTTVIPINKTLRLALEEARKFAVSDWVIEFRGTPVKSTKKGFNAAVRRAGIAPCTRHDLRRTCATWLVQDGVQLEKIARFLGDTKEMIEKVYGHHAPDFLRDAAKSLEA